MHPNLTAILKQIDELVTLPVVVKEVMDATLDPKSTAKSIANIIGNDPILSLKIMRTANSSLFGALFKAKDLEAAVARLGIKQVRSITSAMGVGKLFSGDASPSGYSRLGVWEHSVAVGVMNETLIKVCKINGTRSLMGEALVAGLVHDIGIILEEQYLPEAFSTVPEAVKSTGRCFHLEETAKLGFNHAELGGALLKRWNLSSEVVGAVLGHHEPFSERHDILTVFTMMSEILTADSNVGYSDMNTVSRKEFGLLQTRLGLMGTKIVHARKLFEQEIAGILEIFSLEGSGGGKG